MCEFYPRQFRAGKSSRDAAPGRNANAVRGPSDVDSTRKHHIRSASKGQVENSPLEALVTGIGLHLYCANINENIQVGHNGYW